MKSPIPHVPLVWSVRGTAIFRMDTGSYRAYRGTVRSDDHTEHTAVRRCGFRVYRAYRGCFPTIIIPSCTVHAMVHFPRDHIFL